MFDVRWLIEEETLSRSACARRTSTFCTSTIQHPTSNIPRFGLTLIELLVVIIILTTLVAGVIPLLSPNNDARKIRVAAQGLQTYMAIAQIEAARTGRPHGIAFRESAPGSGVALEVFGLEVAQAFGGFSEASRAKISNPSAPYGGGRFSPIYNGFPIYEIDFVQAGDPDLLPPGMLRVGDEVDILGNRFVIVDDARNTETTFAGSTVSFLDSTDSLFCVWINDKGQVLPRVFIEIPYQIFRQPTNSLESPYQFPSGIAIDLQGSGLSGPEVPPGTLPVGSFATANQDTVGILFSPNGSLESVSVNGNRIRSMSRVFLLLGRAENGGLTAVDWTLNASASNEQLEEKQQQVNWLNLESRWMMIGAQSGRIVVSDNAFVDIRDETTDTDEDGIFLNADADEQIEAAHEFVHEMKR